MELKTFVFITIAYILFLLIFDVGFYLAFYTFFRPEEDNKLAYGISECLSFQWTLTFIGMIAWVVLMFLVGLIADIGFYELSFLGKYLCSSIGLFIILANTTLVVFVCVLLISLKGWFLPMQLIKAEEKSEGIKENISRLKSELKSVDKQVKDEKNKNAKEKLLESKESLQAELATYNIIEWANDDLKTEIRLKLNAHNIKQRDVEWVKCCIE